MLESSTTWTTTGATQALTSDAFIYTDPVFSPDGTRLAYVSTQPNGFFNVFVRPIRNGRWAGDAVQITTDNRYPRNRLYFGFNDMHIEPAWTRDGMSLLLVSNRGVPLGSGHVWKVPLEADAMAKRLSSKGYSAYVLTSANGAPTVYRVRIGTFKTRREAEALATRLQKEEQIKPWVTR